MSKSKIKVEIELPHDFKETLKKEMSDELKEASDKWEVELGLVEKAKVVENSWAQLQMKTQFVFDDRWDFSDHITVFIKSGSSGIIKLTEDKVPVKRRFFIRKSGGWETTEEEFPERVALQDFRDEVIQLLKNWSRTAVFYGVGSYA